jgi:uncharacterized protein (TIGR01370 family)
MRAIFLLVLCFGALSAQAGERERFAVYYSDKIPANNFEDFQLLVLDSRYHPPLKPLSESGKTVLGYVSLGEVEQKTKYFPTLKNNGVLIKENENWKGSHGIDIRDPLWQKIVLEEIIPALLQQGFDGVFFDTLDSPIELERSNPKLYKGMNDAAIQIIQAVRRNYPSIKIMVNRAYTILPKISPYIDMELGESVYSGYDFSKKSYKKIEKELYLLQVKWLQDAKSRNPNLKVYTLDYADKHDRNKIADIYRVQTANGFIPYVTSIGLTEVFQEISLSGDLR